MNKNPAVHFQMQRAAPLPTQLVFWPKWVTRWRPTGKGFSANSGHISPHHHQDALRRYNGPTLRRSQDGANRLGFDRGHLRLLFLSDPQPARKGTVECWGHQSRFHWPTLLDRPLSIWTNLRVEHSIAPLLADYCVQRVSPAGMVYGVCSTTTSRRLWG